MLKLPYVVSVITAQNISRINSFIVGSLFGVQLILAGTGCL